MDRYAFCQYASLRARNAAPAAERRARLAYRLFPAPDITFLLTVDPAVAHDRIESRGYDHEEMSYLRAATDAYRSLPEYAGFVVIDGNRPPDEVAATLRAAVAAVTPVPSATLSGLVRTLLLAFGSLLVTRSHPVTRPETSCPRQGRTGTDAGSSGRGTPERATPRRDEVPHCGRWLRSPRRRAQGADQVWVKPAGNLSMQDVNPNGYPAVQGSDEHRKAGGDARRCDGREPVVS